MKKLLQSFFKKKLFHQICRANAIDLSFEVNKAEVGILKNIFIDREYADYFPFYQKNIIVDAGAHYGYFSLFAACNSDPESQVFSVEASEENFTAMKRNFNQNPSLKTSPILAALSDRNNAVDLLKGKSINNTLVKNPLLTGARTTQVNGLTLDQLFIQLNIQRIDFLKMDIEGAEYQVLRATSEETFKKIKVISMEFHDLKSAENNGYSLIDFLKKHDYTIAKFHYEPTTMGLNYGKIIAIRQ